MIVKITLKVLNSLINCGDLMITCKRKSIISAGNRLITMVTIVKALLNIRVVISKQQHINGMSF